MRPGEHTTGILRKSYHLSLTTNVKDADVLVRNFSDYKIALLSWLELRGRRVGSIWIVVMAPPEIHDSLVAVLQRICREDSDYSDAFAQSLTNVSILDEAGFMREKFVFDAKDKLLTLICSGGPGQFFGDVQEKTKAVS